MTKRALLFAGLLLALATLVSPSHAATRTVALTASGPVPKTLKIKPGDRVQFRNDDNEPHQVKSQGAWQFDSGPVPPGQTSSLTPALTAPGTYRYSDTRGIVLLPETFSGSLVIPKPKPKPTPTPSPTSRPSRSPSPQPTHSPTPAPTTAAVSPSSSPTAVPTPSATHPAPSLSPHPSTPAPTPAPDIRYGGPQALVQGSPHRYGLPVLLGLVGIGGVVSLLGRYLLWLPAGRRTD